MRKRGRPPHDDVLTPAEWSVCESVRHGLTNPEIAARLGIGVDAVKYHVGNALQKLGFRGRDALRRWNGIDRRSNLHGNDTKMTTTLSLGPIGQIARTVADAAASEAWYRDALGARHLYTFGKLVFFDLGGTRLMLSQDDKPPVAESILYFRVDAIHAAAEVLESRGVAFVNAPHRVHTHADGTETWLAFFNDPEGRPLALISDAKPRGD